MTGSVTGIRRRRTVAGRRETSHLPPDRAFYGQTLISQGITDSSLAYHLQEAKKNGITRTEIAEIITHIAFYAGWPKAWAASVRLRRSGKKAHRNDDGSI